MLDGSIVRIVLPSIQDAFALPGAAAHWVSVGAHRVCTRVRRGHMLVGGRPADLYGRRRVFIVGILTFSMSSLVAGLSSSAWMLVAARAVEGMGSGATAPAALALLVTSVSPGPGWRAVLLVNVPIGLGVALVARSM